MVTVQMSGPERLASLDLSTELIAQALRRADAESDTCTALDPPILEGLLRWARATRFLREALLPAGWSQDNPRNLARTIHPSGEFAIVLATGDEWTGRAEYQAGPRHARGYATEQAIYANGQLAFDFGPLTHVGPPGQSSGGRRSADLVPALPCRTGRLSDGALPSGGLRRRTDHQVDRTDPAARHSRG